MDKPQTTIKLSDLNALKQQILSRAAVTLTAIGLTVVAAGAVGQLLPNFATVVPNAYPIPVYFAAVSLPVGGIRAFSVIALGASLQKALLDHLSFAEDSTDTVSEHFRRVFIEEFELDLIALKESQWWLLRGGVALILHAYLLTYLNSGFPKEEFLSQNVEKYLHIYLSGQAIFYYAWTCLGMASIPVAERFAKVLRRWRNRKHDRRL